MAGITLTNQEKRELENVGHVSSLIDDSPARLVLYRHKPDYNTSGAIVADVGTSENNASGNTSYMLKKSKIGRFPWKPGEECLSRPFKGIGGEPTHGCRWCRERAEVQDAPKTGSVSCELCDFVAESTNRGAAISKLKGHMNRLHK